MMKEVAFQPGKFEPVVEVSQRDSGLPAPVETNFVGLEEVSKSTLLVANAANRGTGSVFPDVVPVASAANIISVVLALRNIVEQLLFINVYTRVTTPLRSPRLTVLEPIVRAYNYYGHFSIDDKAYVARGLEFLLVKYLFEARSVCTQEVADGTKWTTRGSTSDIDFSFYHLNDSGEIEFGKRMPLKDYLIKLVKDIDNITDSSDLAIPILRDILQISNEASLVNFLRTIRQGYPDWTPPSRNLETDPTDAHKKAMKKLFGKEYSSQDETIPISLFTAPITLGYAFIRRVTTERSYAMKTIPIPAYEGGSKSQLATYRDDILLSDVPLSLGESTAAVAFTQSFGSLRAFNSAPAVEREELLRELVSQSLLPARR